MTALRVFITGASSGVGAALARHYAAQGAQLGLAARRADKLAPFVNELPGCAIYPLDVRDHLAMQAAGADFIARFGVPDVVIAAAGISVGTLTEHAADLEVFQAVMDINVIGMVTTFQPFVAAMRDARRGVLAGIASVAGIRGLPGGAAYSASKAAAITYLESLRVELFHSGVAVTTISPGYIVTPMTAVNPYPMPFILQADVAAAKIARAIARRRRYLTLPWQMALVAWVLGLLPRALYDRLFWHAPHKPRNLPL
ncbi:short-chain dehydrogenase [Sulfuriferula plumbiphila]|uniref:Short-chain dehydrogenase n=1 Tax=Sulfuriferula plumbiphila TaxID=171865 RepID=A0A512L5A6_9PROT|nr:SDR family oxidoreductase [Sulfuriferula plumbiphila]BBP05862.1 short-chain dehydrogenase [Sulfuriferula plumbiphila]GEP29632.1 short-chain dehydrogenase [Sulfuriferula plumbiphila]